MISRMQLYNIFFRQTMQVLFETKNCYYYHVILKIIMYENYTERIEQTVNTELLTGDCSNCMQCVLNSERYMALLMIRFTIEFVNENSRHSMVPSQTQTQYLVHTTANDAKYRTIEISGTNNYTQHAVVE